MATYLRKSFTIGPFRINISKSGIGMSFGITGLRVGTGPKGPYIHAGRGGLYFKKSLKEQDNVESIDNVEELQDDELTECQVEEVVPEEPKEKFLFYLKKCFILMLNILFWAIMIYIILIVLMLHAFTFFLKASNKNSKSVHKHKRRR